MMLSYGLGSMATTFQPYSIKHKTTEEIGDLPIVNVASEHSIRIVSIDFSE
jgi:hypothetical protein